ncbi:MAG: type II toxin-antitoxin system RelE/ParE family toxin, partial [Candidatus Gracilibacteria bacterium]|nr:type II toxin-antitoxin system RelE/ParE family toxin [Candidatus Gracilibacteria bacterium]
LGGQIFKYRIKNSSIPTGKRGGFRMIIKIHGDKILPILIYSKTIKENVSDNEIIHALEKIFQELQESI